MSENVKKERTKRGFICGIVVVAVVCLAVVYFCMGLFYSKHMFANVKINGLNASNKTVKQIRSELESTAENYTLTIIERGGAQEVINGSDFDLKLSFDDSLDEILANQSMFEWGLHIFKPTSYEIGVTAQYDSDKLNDLITKLDCMDSKNMESPIDAYIDYDEESGLTFVEAKEGSRINKKDILQAVENAVCSVETQINLDELGVYVAPKVASDDEALNKRYNLLKKYLDMVITYHFDSNSEVLDRNTFYDWILETSDGSMDFDQDMIKDYVKSLASKHNTAYRKHELATSYGQTITITTGSYGWIIDQEAEREELYNVLMAGVSQDREPIYSQEAASHDGNDYGDTYVEVNLSAQHLFFYVDGKLLIETDFVSGNASKGWSTPGGIFPLTYKERNATLRGANYATPVSYWMPFNGNIGLHDSTWRSTYGKNIYKTNGSHGCINLPPSAAAVIYENIEKGMPVICYYLDGTGVEPDSVIVKEADPNEGTVDSDTDGQDAGVTDDSADGQDTGVTDDSATDNPVTDVVTPSDTTIVEQPVTDTEIPVNADASGEQGQELQ